VKETPKKSSSIRRKKLEEQKGGLVEIEKLMETLNATMTTADEEKKTTKNSRKKRPYPQFSGEEN